MNVRTVTGTSIHAALAEARRLLGDDVVLLEATPPEGAEPARITVVADAGAPRAAAAPVPATPAEAATPLPVGYGYRAYQPAAVPPASPEESAPAAERFSPKRRPAMPASGAEKAPLAAPEAGRGRLFSETTDVPAAGVSLEEIETLFETRLSGLHARLEAMERRLSSAVVGASHRWMAHPLAGALLRQGLRPATVASLFDHLTAEGIAPEADAAKIQWKLAHELRRRLTISAPKQAAGTQLFIGPSGAGKTALVLKLATHPEFYARHKTAVIVIRPEDEAALPYQDPVALYRRFGVPVQSVATPEEMQDALARLDTFDQVLLDTPPLPSTPEGATAMLRRLRGFVEAVTPLSVHLVVNATRALDGLDAAFLERLPLRPTAVSLTHLDETAGWGRLAEWLLALGLPVPFVGTGPRTPDDLAAFSPTWFVEEIMKL